MREERPRNTVSSLTTQQKTWAEACKEETSDSESTQLSEAHGSKIKKRKRKLMASSSTSKDIQHNASNVKQVHSSTGDPNRSRARTVGGVRLRQELEIRQLSKYNLPKWESKASDDEPLWKLVTNRKPGPPKVDIYLGNLPEEMTKEKVTKYIQRRAQSAGESPPTIFRCTVQNAKPQNDGTIKTYARLTIKKTDRDLISIVDSGLRHCTPGNGNSINQMTRVQPWLRRKRMQPLVDQRQRPHPNDEFEVRKHKVSIN